MISGTIGYTTQVLRDLIELNSREIQIEQPLNLRMSTTLAHIRETIQGVEIRFLLWFTSIALIKDISVNLL